MSEPCSATRAPENDRERTRPRIHELDALRGFAICGIMVVNTWQHTRGDLRFPADTSVDWVIGRLLEGRFYPIFSFLFGLGFVLFLDSARARTEHARLALLMRLVVLACFGLLHQLVNPGEVLLPYAAFGVVVLLPASYLPRPVVLLTGVGGVVWAVLTDDPWLLIAGLFPLGMALIRYRPSQRLLLPAFAVSAVLGAVSTWLWIDLTENPEGYVEAGVEPLLTLGRPVAALTTATAYATGLLLLVRASRTVSAVLEPLGRMALTNYLSSTALILLALPYLTADETRRSVVIFALGVLVVQGVLSRWWLSRHRYGPLEWIWRCATWWRIEPNRSPDPEAGRTETV